MQGLLTVSNGDHYTPRLVDHLRLNPQMGLTGWISGDWCKGASSTTSQVEVSKTITLRSAFHFSSASVLLINPSLMSPVQSISDPPGHSQREHHPHSNPDSDRPVCYSGAPYGCLEILGQQTQAVFSAGNLDYTTHRLKLSIVRAIWIDVGCQCKVSSAVHSIHGSKISLHFAHVSLLHH